MPGGNKKGGKKHKRNKNNNDFTKVLRVKEDGQEYARVTRCKGNCRFDVSCCDGKDRAAILCGAMRKRKFINQGQIVLVSLRDFQDDICDIIDSYDENQSRKLKENGGIPPAFSIEEENMFTGDTEDTIDFSNELPSTSSEEESEEDEIDLDDI